VAYLWIALGAIVGASARYFVSGFVAQRVSPGFPYGTLLINVTGSFVLGLFLTWAGERVLTDPKWRLMIAVGFQLCVREFCARRAGAVADDGGERHRQQRAVPWRCADWCSAGEVIVKWRPLWLYKSRCT